MVHEMAHHKIRSHDSNFPAEMQRIEYKLQANKEGDFNAIKRAIIKLVQDHSDIIAEGKRIYEYESITPTRKRLQDNEERIEPNLSYERIFKGDRESGAKNRTEQRVQPSIISGRGTSGQRSEAGISGSEDEGSGALSPQYQTRYKAPP